MATKQFIANTEVICSLKKKSRMPVKEITIYSSYNVYEYVLDIDVMMKNIDYRECMIALYVTRANVVTGYSVISIGGICGTVFDPRIILQPAILLNSSGIILAHNHPGGSLKPSAKDITLTKKIKEGAKLFDIQLLDHLIVTNNGYYSFGDEGTL